MHIAIVTAGGAGMFCGSCMHDNTWAKALIAAGHEVSLIPTYTPLRLDENSEALGRVFFGGINVYLNDRYRWWSSAPRFMTRWLDHPGIIRLATRWSVSNQAQELGELTLSMLRGEEGPHRKAVEELDSFISDHLKPDVVIFSNALLVGALRVLRQRFDGPILSVLQGDDVFLDGLSEEYKQPVIDLMSQRSAEFDGFLVHSEFYRDYMAEYLNLPTEKFRVIPLGIEMEGNTGTVDGRPEQPFTIGYFARIAPEKGLHHLAEGFVRFKEHASDARLRIGGYLGPGERAYFGEAIARLGNYDESVKYIGSPKTHEQKVEFLKSIDVLSVPTDFQEPKGLYVLEAMANGTPVVQPNHGAFPEILGKTEGGILVEPKNPDALADGLAKMSDQPTRRQHAESGWKKVRDQYSAEVMAKRTIEVLEEFTNSILA